MKEGVAEGAGRRVARTLASAITILLFGTSCAVVHEVPRGEVDARATRFHHFARARGQDVFGYTTIDGVYHPFEGNARLVGDTLVFHRSARRWKGLQAPQPTVTERVALADLESVRSQRIDPGRSVVFAMTVSAIGFALLAIGFMASWHGPFG